MKMRAPAVAGLLAGMIVIAGPVSAATNWTQYGYSTEHSSFNSAEKTLKRTNVTALFAAWSPNLGEGPVATPIVANGIAFVAAGDSVVALDIRNAAQLWSSLTCTGSPAAEVAFSRNRVFVGDLGGDLAAYDAATGAMIWCRDAGGSIDSALAVDADSVYLTNHGDVIAVDQSSGNARWRYSVTGQPGPSSSAAIGSKAVFVTGPGTLHALRKTDGRLLWQKALGSPYELSSPAVSGDTVYVGADRLYALSANDGKTEWISPAAGVNVTTPAIAGDRLFVNSRDPSFGLFAIDAKRGTLVWRSQIPGESQATPAVANGVVYDISEFGELMMFDATNGSFLASRPDSAGRPFSSRTGAQATVINGAVYLATEDPSGTDGIDEFKLPTSTLAPLEDNEKNRADEISVP